MRKKLVILQNLRDKIRRNGCQVPTKPLNDISIMKVNMRNYMENSGVCQYLHINRYPHADPLLLGFKAAINAYFAKTGDKLLPACLPDSSDDDSSSDDDIWPPLQTEKRVISRPFSDICVQKEVDIDMDSSHVPLVSDDDDLGQGY